MTKTQFIESLFFPLVFCFVAVSLFAAILMYPPIAAVLPTPIPGLLNGIFWVIVGRLFLFVAKKKIDKVK